MRNVTKVSPVLKQIINKRKEETPLSSCDSVEHSFKEKLSLQSRRQDKEEKELEVFEMLEGATLNSSFSRSYNHIRYMDYYLVFIASFSKSSVWFQYKFQHQQTDGEVNSSLTEQSQTIRQTATRKVEAALSRRYIINPFYHVAFSINWQCF